MTAVGMPCACAIFSPPASARLLITAAMRHGSLASSRACRVLPRPGMRMTIFFTGFPKKNRGGGGLRPTWWAQPTLQNLRLRLGAVARAYRADDGGGFSSGVE